LRRTANNSQSGERTGAVAALLPELTKYPGTPVDNLPHELTVREIDATLMMEVPDRHANRDGITR
jgi:hypothetical protein